MAVYLLLAATVILACVIFNRISSRLGIPALLAFILLGIFFGSDGLVKISFNNYAFAQQVCTLALVFIMFYGGFGTKWSAAKPVAAKALLLSSLGTVLTAGFVGLFCRFILNIPLLESFLIGAVISSTDAASVFSILRSRHLNLKHNTASLLELESGSNDPFSYMLTVIVLSIMQGGVSGWGFAYMVFAQLVYGAAFGVIIGALALKFLQRFHFTTDGFDAIFIVAAAIIAYAAPDLCGGNGYLSAYIAGIILGNRRIDNKQSLVHFFDGATGLMQVLLFFLLGLLSTPSRLPVVALTGLAVALFLTFIARPAAVFLLLSPFKSPIRQSLLVSWSGLRGAASIVFAIMCVTSPAQSENDIFHIVFFIVLFSILLQGTLLPLVAKKLDMIDDGDDVMKTFNDYAEEAPVEFIQCVLTAGHPWVGKTPADISLPPDTLFVLLLRGGGKLVPNGKTRLCVGDNLILGGKSAEKISGVRLYERTLEKGHRWINRQIADIPSGDGLIIMVKRGKSVIIPAGDTVLLQDDTLVINNAVQP